MMKSWMLFCLVVCLAVQGELWAKAAGLNWPEAFETADVVAKIKVTESVELYPKIMKRDAREYRSIATAEVVSAFKGCKGKETIEILHSNGFACPNVIYRAGKEYIVFLRRAPASKLFVTMSYYAGQFPIEEGMVLGFYLWPKYNHEADFKLPLAEVERFLRGAS